MERTLQFQAESAHEASIAHRLTRRMSKLDDQIETLRRFKEVMAGI
jgi:hypothetical protein